MDDNFKYVETSSDLNVEGVEFYLGTVENELIGAPIYKDKELTQLATIEELNHYYETNDLILVGKTTTDDDFRSRVNVVAAKDNAYMVFYHQPEANIETEKIELVSKYSLLMEEVEPEPEQTEGSDGQEG